MESATETEDEMNKKILIFALVFLSVVLFDFAFGLFDLIVKTSLYINQMDNSNTSLVEARGYSYLSNIVFFAEVVILGLTAYSLFGKEPKNESK